MTILSTNSIYAIIAGGVFNEASDDYATVGGGWNLATGYVATIPGGAGNETSDDCSNNITLVGFCCSLGYS